MTSPKQVIVLIAACGVLWMPAIAGAQSAVAQDQARDLLQSGVALYDAHDYATALQRLRASLALYASPNSRLYVARCLVELGRLVEAVAEYERTRGEAAERSVTDPRYEPTRVAAAEELSKILPRIGHVRLRLTGAPPGTQVQVAGHPAPAAAVGLPMAVMPGRVELRIEVPGRPPVLRDVTVAAGRVEDVEQDLSLPAAPLTEAKKTSADAPADAGSPGLRRPLAWAALGVGAAGIGAFGAFWYVADHQYRELDDRCTAGGCPPVNPDDVTRGKTFETLSHVFLAVGLVGAAAGVVLFALPSPSARTSQAATRVTASFQSIAVSGSF